MPVYSFQGYLAALALRTSGTLIVEGVTDRGAAWRLIREMAKQQACDASRIVVDTAEMLQSFPGVYSNREKVEHVLESTSTLDPVAGWVDREYREFEVDGEIRDCIGGHKVVGNCYWTRGHSLENYTLATELAIEFLESYYPSEIPHNYAEIAALNFIGFLKNAAALSLAVRSANLLNRCSGIFGCESWVVSEDHLDFNIDSFAGELMGRGVPQSVVDALVLNYHSKLAEVSVVDSDLVKWLLHGHIGTEMFWSALGSLMRANGMSPQLSKQVAKGDGDGKLRIAHGNWVKMCISRRESAPTAFLDWLQIILSRVSP
jgi:hypothetical protein